MDPTSLTTSYRAMKPSHFPFHIQTLYPIYSHEPSYAQGKTRGTYDLQSILQGTQFLRRRYLLDLIPASHKHGGIQDYSLAVFFASLERGGVQFMKNNRGFYNITTNLLLEILRTIEKSTRP